MCVIAKVGRYFAQSGMNLAAQQPNTIRWFQGLSGFGGTLAMTSAINLMTSSASLSSCSHVRAGVLMLSTEAYLDIQQYPHILRTRCSQKLQQILQSRHGIMWSCECSLLTDVVIGAVYYFVFLTKASFEIRILKLWLDVGLGFLSASYLHERAPQHRPLSDVYQFLLHAHLPSPRPGKHPWCSRDALPCNPDARLSGAVSPPLVVCVRTSMTLPAANQHCLMGEKAGTHGEAE